MTHLDDATDLRTVMERSLRDLDQPDDLQSTVLARGRRVRRRRRAVAAGSGLAASVAVVGLAVTTLQSPGQPGSGTDPASPAAPAAAADPVAPMSTVPPSASPGWWDVPADELAQRLEGVLPEGVTLVSVDPLVETGGDERVLARGTVSGVLRGPSGPGAFQVMLSPPAAGSGERAVRATELRCAPVHTQCRQVRTDGTPTARFSTTTDQGTTYREAVVREPDNGRVYLYVADSSGEKPGYEAPTASAPPLGADQLRALAQDPVWTTWVP